MPAERVAMRQAREIIRLKFSAGLPTREIARRLGVAASTVRGTLRRFEGAGLSWPLPVGMSDGDLEAALYANHGTKRSHRRHAEPDRPTVHRRGHCKRAEPASPPGVLGIWRGAISGRMKVTFQAARVSG